MLVWIKHIVITDASTFGAPQIDLNSGGGTAILDGEAVVLDDVGRSDFGALQQALGGRGGKRSAGQAIFYAFDLLYFDGHDLRQMELSERRQVLPGVVHGDAAEVMPGYQHLGWVHP
ncbi:hypothetical protein CCGE531_32320 (plasmid) [Rhizobium sp. CCGE531]|nr:hypothetical protein CCGE531_32320 [Rhizobium sp. CCGE531]